MPMQVTKQTQTVDQLIYQNMKNHSRNKMAHTNHYLTELGSLLLISKLLISFLESNALQLHITSIKK